MILSPDFWQTCKPMQCGLLDYEQKKVTSVTKELGKAFRHEFAYVVVENNM